MAGAFGAHALASTLSERGAEVWDTAVLYHLVHALALVLVAALLAGGSTSTNTLQNDNDPAALADSPGSAAPAGPVLAGWAFTAGILAFSGSLYGLALEGPGWLGPVTPLGGIGFIVGWLALLWHGLTSTRV
ncbi:MAG: DUF423 domain-containing protein [Pseudomonadota bacterium]